MFGQLKFDRLSVLVRIDLAVCVQMWMSVLWDLTVTNMRDVRTQRAPTPAHVPTLTVEMAKTAQVTKCNERCFVVYFISIHV